MKKVFSILLAITMFVSVMFTSISVLADGARVKNFSVQDGTYSNEGNGCYIFDDVISDTFSMSMDASFNTRDGVQTGIFLYNTVESVPDQKGYYVTFSHQSDRDFFTIYSYDDNGNWSGITAETDAVERLPADTDVTLVIKTQVKSRHLVASVTRKDTEKVLATFDLDLSDNSNSDCYGFGMANSNISISNVVVNKEAANPDSKPDPDSKPAETLPNGRNKNFTLVDGVYKNDGNACCIYDDEMTDHFEMSFEANFNTANGVQAGVFVYNTIQAVPDQKGYYIAFAHEAERDIFTIYSYDNNGNWSGVLDELVCTERLPANVDVIIVVDVKVIKGKLLATVKQKGSDGVLATFDTDLPNNSGCYNYGFGAANSNIAISNVKVSKGQSPATGVELPASLFVVSSLAATCMGCIVQWNKRKQKHMK